MAAQRMPEGFDKADYPLHRCHVWVYEGMIFINLAEGEPTDFDIIIKTLDPFVSHFAIGRTKIVHRETYPTHGNWKLAVENFRECYHCAPAHPEYTMVNAYVATNDRKASAYTPTVEAWNEKTAAMGHPTGRCRNGTDLPGQPHGAFRQPIREGFLTLSEDGQPGAPLLGDIKEFDGGECMVIFGPLFYLYCANDHITTFRFTPVNGQLTDVVLTWLVREDAAEGDYDVDRLKWMWDVTTVQDNYAVAGPLNVAQQVRRQKDANAEVATDALDHVQHLFSPAGVQAGGRLIKKHEYGVMHKGLCQLDPLLHPGGVLTDGTVTFLVQAHMPQYVGRTGPGMGCWQAAYLRHVRKELRCCDRGGEAVMLRHIAKPGPDFNRLVGFLPQHRGGARRRLEQSQEQLDGGALARAVGAQDAGNAL